MDTVKDQVTGSISQMRNLTTAYTFIPRTLMAPLRQTMIRRDKQLHIGHIIRSALRTRLDLEDGILQSTVSKAFEHGFRETMRERWGQWKQSIASPTSEVLDSTPQDLYQLGAIHYNCGTLDGTYEVHQAIMLNQFSLDIKANSQQFREQLRLFHGDQKTVAFIRSVRSDQVDSECPYEKRDWLLPIPGLFHVQMHVQQVLLRTHWTAANQNGASTKSKHTLLSDLGFLSYTGISRDNAPFHALDHLIKVSFDARILAFFFRILESEGLLNPSEDRIVEHIEHVLQTISKRTYNTAIAKLMNLLFSKDSLIGEGKSTTGNKQKLPKRFVTLCRFMQIAQIYLVLRTVVRHGNTRAISQLCPLLSLIFLGAGKFHYGREMLYLSWLQQKNVSEPFLRQAILDSMLINRQGRKDSFMPTDRQNELMNCDLALDLQMRKNSTHDFKKTFNMVALSGPFLARMKRSMESAVKVKISGKHTTKSSELDVRNLAVNLWRSRQMDWDLPASQPSQDNEYLASDVIGEGLERLEKAVRSFNSDVVDQGPYEFLEQEDDPEPTAPQDIPTITTDLVDLEDSEDSEASEDLEDLENLRDLENQ